MTACSRRSTSSASAATCSKTSPASTSARCGARASRVGCGHDGGAEGDRGLGRRAREHRDPDQHLGLPRLSSSPSTASIIHGNLGLADTCQNFDVGNACLAFLNGMDIAARMIERGDIEYAPDRRRRNAPTRSPRSTIERLSRADATEADFRNDSPR
jgi:hypothetical protein